MYELKHTDRHRHDPFGAPRTRGHRIVGPHAQHEPRRHSDIAVIAGLFS